MKSSRPTYRSNPGFSGPFDPAAPKKESNKSKKSFSRAKAANKLGSKYSGPKTASRIFASKVAYKNKPKYKSDGDSHTSSPNKYRTESAGSKRVFEGGNRSGTYKPSQNNSFKPSFSKSHTSHTPNTPYIKPNPSPIPNENPYPMRINKYLALKNYSTRRGSDELIEKKKVFINGKLATLGSKINEGDTVEVRYSGILKPYVYYAYNKPQGTITHSPQHGEKDIRAQMISLNKMIRKQMGEHKTSEAIPRVFPIGRLDKDSNGLIILTNDGRITDKLLNPEFEHDKEYIVTTVNKIRDSFKENMERGVEIEGYTTKPCKVKVMGEHTFKITLTEGKKHQIRRMCEAMHNQVKSLTRVRVMNIDLGKLAENSVRKIEGQELEIFLESLGVNNPLQ